MYEVIAQEGRAERTYLSLESVNNIHIQHISPKIGLSEQIKYNTNRFVKKLMVFQLLATTETVIMEPVMNLEVITDADRMSFVVSDLSRRRADISELTSRGQSRVRISVFFIENVFEDDDLSRRWRSIPAKNLKKISI